VADDQLAEVSGCQRTDRRATPDRARTGCRRRARRSAIMTNASG